LSGRGLCDELITRPEESYRLCCVVVCDLETSRMGAPYIYDISHLRVNMTSPLCSHFMDIVHNNYLKLRSLLFVDAPVDCYFVVIIFITIHSLFLHSFFRRGTRSVSFYMLLQLYHPHCNADLVPGHAAMWSGPCGEGQNLMTAMPIDSAGKNPHDLLRLFMKRPFNKAFH